MQDQLGDNIAILQVQSGQPMYCALVSTGAWVNANPDLAESFLKALAQAESFLAAHPDEGESIIQTRLNYDSRYMAAIWPEHRFSLRLEQSLVLALEDQARWMMQNGLTGATVMPDFMNYIRQDTLKAIKPGGVSLIY